jgi:cbb3-type cytochrome oxidase subunit 3
MVQGPVTDRRFSRRAVRQALLIGAGVLVVAGLAGGGWFAYRSAARSAAEEAAAALQAEAQAVAGRAIDPINEASRKLLALGKDPEIVALFEQRDIEGLEAAAARHTADFASAIKLRLLLPGGYGLEPDAQPPLSFASLDMLGNAERSPVPVAVEAHGFGTPNQHIVIIRRAANKADQLIGLLHLSLDVAILETGLSALDLGRSYVELQQPAGGKTAVLAKAGSGSKGQPIIVSVPNTRWNLAYWPVGGRAAGMAGFSVDWIMLGGGVLVVLLISAGVVFWMQRPSVTISGEEPRRRPDKSGVIYAGAVKAIMEGAHPGMEQLVPNLPRFGMKGPVMPVSQGMAGDDITMIARKDTLQPAQKAAPRAGAPAAKPAAKPAMKPAARPPVPGSETPTDPPQKKSPQ